MDLMLVLLVLAASNANRETVEATDKTYQLSAQVDRWLTKQVPEPARKDFERFLIIARPVVEQRVVITLTW